MRNFNGKYGFFLVNFWNRETKKISWILVSLLHIHTALANWNRFCSVFTHNKELRRGYFHRLQWQLENLSFFSLCMCVCESVCARCSQATHLFRLYICSVGRVLVSIHFIIKSTLFVHIGISILWLKMTWNKTIMFYIQFSLAFHFSIVSVSANWYLVNGANQQHRCNAF